MWMLLCTIAVYPEKKGKSHPAIQRLFLFHADVFDFLRPGEHDKQLYDHILEAQQQQSLHRRSVFGMIQIYIDFHNTWLTTRQYPCSNGILP